MQKKLGVTTPRLLSLPDSSQPEDLTHSKKQSNGRDEYGKGSLHLGVALQIVFAVQSYNGTCQVWKAVNNRGGLTLGGGQ